MQVRSLGFATDLAVLRAAGSTITEGDDHLVVRTPSNPGYWWGNFLLVGAEPSVAQGMDAFHREFPDARYVAIGVDRTDGAVPPAADELGLDADVSVVLTTRTVGAARAVDAEVRPLADDGDWEQLFVLRSQDDHPAADEVYRRRRVQEARRLVDSGAAVFLGAFRDAQLVSTLGIVCDGSGTARYQSVQTHPDHRRQGLAGHLVAEAAQAIQQRREIDRFVIVADPEGPAIDLYRSLGFRDTERQVQLMSEPRPSAAH